MKKYILWQVIAIMVIFLTGCGIPNGNDTGIAPVEEIEIIILESFPVQVFVKASGYLPNPCIEIDTITQKREGNDFYITIKTLPLSDICIPMITSFEEVISLEVYGLPAGTYTVDVNGVQDSFILEMDNILLTEKQWLYKHIIP